MGSKTPSPAKSLDDRGSQSEQQPLAYNRHSLTQAGLGALRLSQLSSCPKKGAAEGPSEDARDTCVG